MLSNKETLSEKFIKKGFWLYLFSFIIGPLGYFIKVIISRDLSVEEVGMVYGVISFVTFLAMYNDL
jgi:O-antigen/teichoic acid export membrane protein